MARRVLDTAREGLRTRISRPAVEATVLALPVGTGRAVLAGHTPASTALPAFVADAGLSVLSRLDRGSQEAWMSALANAASGIAEVREAARHASREYLGPVGSGSDDWYWSSQARGDEDGDEGWCGSKRERRERRKRRRHRDRAAREHASRADAAGDAGPWAAGSEAHGSPAHEHVKRAEEEFGKAWKEGERAWERSREHLRAEAEGAYSGSRKRSRRVRRLRRFAAKVRDRLVPRPAERLMRDMPWEFRDGDTLVLQHTSHIPAPLAQTLLATAALTQRASSTGLMAGSAIGSLMFLTAFSALPGSSLAAYYLIYRTACHARARNGARFVIDAMEDDAVELRELPDLGEYVDGRQNQHGAFLLGPEDAVRVATLAKMAPASLLRAFESVSLYGGAAILPRS